ncbi:MAG: hypothetical protein JWM47_3528 [Acidimicrobiales bacterium]|nr:hypothetical protein [Acidimicrobiales bacterium]
MPVEEMSVERLQLVLQETDKRTGERRQVGIPVKWRAPRSEGPLERSRPRNHEVPPGEAILHDLSVSGARLLMAADPSVVHQALLQLEVEGEWAAAQVVRTEPTRHPSAMWCGVTFVHPSTTFMAAIFRSMAAANP